MRALIPAELEGWAAESFPFPLQSPHAGVVKPRVRQHFGINNSKGDCERDCIKDPLNHRIGGLISAKCQYAPPIRLQEAESGLWTIRFLEVVDRAPDGMSCENLDLHRGEQTLEIIATCAGDNFAADTRS